MPSLEHDQFPRLNRPVRARWATVFFSPIIASPERLIIGVVAANAAGFHLERANALDRLNCLYEDAAETAIFTATLALDELEADCAKRGVEALTDPQPGFSGVSLGTISHGEAAELRDIARTRMASLSSLYDAAGVSETAKEQVPFLSVSDAAADRLPTLVLDYVSSRRARLAASFNEDIRERRTRRRRSKVHGLIIDFHGSRLVANFGTLLASSQAASVDRIKRRMWDLAVSRDTERGVIVPRRHELILQHPRPDDPQVTERQYGAIVEAIDDLAGQATNQDIGLLPMTDVNQIGDHILQAEAA